MKLHVCQHISCEHPGILRQFLSEDEIGWDAIGFNRGDRIPRLDDYDLLWVMGGPMDVWDIEECPWLPDERPTIQMPLDTPTGHGNWSFLLGHRRRKPREEARYGMQGDGRWRSSAGAGCPRHDVGMKFH